MLNLTSMFKHPRCIETLHGFIRFHHKCTTLHTEGWTGEWWNCKYALMLNVVITERRIVIQSIACVNNASAAPSHYALLMSNLWFILVRLSIYRNSGTGDESISFSSSFWSSCSLFWCRVSRDVFRRDYMFIMQVITNKSVIKLLSLSVCLHMYNSVCVCVCGWVCTLSAFTLICCCYTLQWDATTIKEPI